MRASRNVGLVPGVDYRFSDFPKPAAAASHAPASRAPKIKNQKKSESTQPKLKITKSWDGFHKILLYFILFIHFSLSSVLMSVRFEVECRLPSLPLQCHVSIIKKYSAFQKLIA